MTSGVVNEAVVLIETKIDVVTGGGSGGGGGVAVVVAVVVDVDWS